jgi:hypothetical protein
VQHPLLLLDSCPLPAAPYFIMVRLEGVEPSSCCVRNGCLSTASISTITQQAVGVSAPNINE